MPNLIQMSPQNGMMQAFMPGMMPGQQGAGQQMGMQQGGMQSMGIPMQFGMPGGQFQMGNPQAMGMFGGGGASQYPFMSLGGNGGFMMPNMNLQKMMSDQSKASQSTSE